MTDDRRRALDALLATLEAGCEVVEEPWGTIAVNPEFPRIHMANFLWLRTLPLGGLDAALRRLDEVLAPYGIRDRPVYVEDTALSSRLVPAFAERGFTAKPEHVMFARGPPKLAANPAVTVRPARDQATRDDHDGIAGLIHEEEGFDYELSHQMLSLGWRRASLLGSETFVAYLEGSPAGNVAFGAVDGVGSLFEVETVPALRGRGVAATMVLHVRRRAEASELAPFFLQTPVEDTTWRMYEKLGFAREGTLAGYLLARP